MDSLVAQSKKCISVLFMTMKCKTLGKKKTTTHTDDYEERETQDKLK